MTNNLLGSLIGLVGIVLALITHMMVKDLTYNVDFLMILFGRFVFSLPLLFIFAIIARKNNFLQINNWFYVLLRSVFGLTTMLLVFLSLQLIPIGLVTALAQSSAIFVTILAPIILGEKIGIKRWIAVLVGLLGVYLMTNPLGIINGTSNLSPIGLTMATISALTHAGLALILRKLGKTEHPTTTALIHNCITSFFVVSGIIIFGSNIIGQNSNTCTYLNSAINFKINQTEKRLLEKMINNPGKVFSRAEIGNIINLNKERSIDVIITRLRKKIELSPKSPKYLQTIRGSGYVLWIE